MTFVLSNDCMLRENIVVVKEINLHFYFYSLAVIVDFSEDRTTPSWRTKMRKRRLVQPFMRPSVTILGVRLASDLTGYIAFVWAADYRPPSDRSIFHEYACHNSSIMSTDVYRPFEIDFSLSCLLSSAIIHNFVKSCLVEFVFFLVSLSFPCNFYRNIHFIPT